MHYPNISVSSQSLISIITATYNAEKYLPSLISSIRGQNYKKIQWIVVDGGSDDTTCSILQKNINLIDTLISEPDDGIYDAWNKGVRQAKGEWIYFLGADDFLWSSDVMEQMSHRLMNVPEDVKVVYGKIMLVNQTAKEISVAGEPWEKIKDRFLQVMSIPHQGVFHRRSLFEQYGNFDSSFRIAGDYELLLRELKNKNAIFIPEIIAGMRQGGISNKPENTIRALKEIRRAQKMHGFKRLGQIWSFAYMRAHIRTWAWQIIGERRVCRLLDVYRRARGLPAYWTKL